MPGHPFSADHSSPPTALTAQASTDPTALRQLSRDQVDRWAKLIAQGQTEFPNEPPPADPEQLLSAVRRLSRPEWLPLSPAIALKLKRDATDGKR